MIGSACLFLGIRYVPFVQKLLTRQPFRWLGKVSFSLYLVHYPILLTLVSALFVVLSGSLSYGFNIALVIPVGILLTFSVAAIFEACVDRPAVVLSRTVTQARRPALGIVPGGPA
jgi:peptidoglycan/LPS O-acetylase OafA/YrhL